MEDRTTIGAIQEITIVHTLHRGLASNKASLREVMARPMPQIDSGVLLEEVYRILLAGHAAVTVMHEGRLVGLITRSDLVEYYQRSAAELPE